MKRSQLLLLLLAVALVTVLALRLWRNSPQSNALHAREWATRVLAEHLVKARAGQRALVISNPFTQQKDVAKEIKVMEQAGLDGLKAGFGASVRIEAIAFPSLKPEAQQDPRSVFIDAETTTPLSFLVAEDAFDQLRQRHPGCDLIVSLIGLPAALNRVQCWHAEGPPRFALLLPDLRMIGGADAIRKAMQSGKLVAFVLNKPDAPASDAAMGGDWKKEFEKRFLLCTAENIEQVIQSYPQLFPTR